MRKATNISFHSNSVSQSMRETLNGHKGKVFWFTGLSGSGKSTIVNFLDEEMHSQGLHTSILDGDNLRNGLNEDLEFTQNDRSENLRRAAHIARLMMNNGTIVLSAFITPLENDRERITSIVGANNIVWIHVDCSLDVCEERDPKKLYQKARSGQIPNFTGIDAPFEEPTDPDFVAKSELFPAHTIAKEILANFASTIAL